MALTQSTSGMISKHGILKYDKTFTQLTAAGDTDHINVPGARFHTFQVTTADTDTNVSISVDGSLDGTNFFKVPLKVVTVTGITYSAHVATITTDDTFLIYVDNVALENVRFSFDAEVGGTAATIDVVYFGRS